MGIAIRFMVASFGYACREDESARPRPDASPGRGTGRTSCDMEAISGRPPGRDAGNDGKEKCGPERAAFRRNHTGYIGRASWVERGCQYVYFLVVHVKLKKK